MRRLRGVVTTALIWAVIWGLAGVALVAYQAVRHWDRFHYSATIMLVHVPRAFATLGAFSGIGFAIVLASLERRRTFEQLSMRRVAGWGALGGMALPILSNIAMLGTQSSEDLIPVAAICAVMGALGAGCAAGTLALARRPLTVTDRS